MNHLEIIVGTYEEYLLGFKVEQKSKDKSVQLTKSFASHCHTASVRCVASSGRYVSSGGADDKVFIFDMVKRQELSLLNHQLGTVSTMAFTPDTTHLFTGGSDGSMIAYSTSTWDVHKKWGKAHKGNAITQIRIHPSGKLAVTLGSELNMQMWNLVKGTCVNTTSLKNIPSLGRIVDSIEWNPNGQYLAISGAKEVQFWNTKAAVCERICKTESRPTCLAWISDEIILIGLENGQVLITENCDEKMEKPIQINAHEKRVKGLEIVKNFVASISSNGEVSLWKLNSNFSNLTSIAKTNIGCRPTCVCLIDNSEFGALKEEEEPHLEDSVVDLEEEQKPAKRKIIEESVEVIEEDNFEEVAPKKTLKRNNKKLKQDSESDSEDDSAPGKFVRPINVVNKKQKNIKFNTSVDNFNGGRKKNKKNKKLNRTIS